MRLYKFENREIRSFRMRERTLKLKAFFDSNTRAACFIMSDSIQPQDRAELREILAHHNLKVTLLSKKVVNLWMQNSQWGPIKELLKGNVIQVESINKETGENLPFTEEKLQFIMGRDIFSVRLFVENQKAYRKEKVKTFLDRSAEGINFKTAIVTETVKAPLFKGPFVSEFLFAKGHYN